MAFGDVKNLIRSGEPVKKGYGSFVEIDDSYWMGNGVLLDRDGEVLWQKKWEHAYFSVVYLKKHHVILTDRLAMPGPMTIALGLCCIDMSTGDYRWKHWYNSQEERAALYRGRKGDINLVRGLGPLDPEDEYMFKDGFKIRISDGSYDSIDDDNVPENLKRPDLSTVRDLKRINGKSTDNRITFGVDSVQLGEKEFRREGYFFNKCGAVIEKGPYIYFFGVPAKRNERGALLFRYSTVAQEMDGEVEMPFRTGPEGIYRFFEDGFVIHEEKTGKVKEHSLWLLAGSSL